MFCSIHVVEDKSLRSHSRAHRQPRSPTHLAISRSSSKNITSSSTLIFVVTGRVPYLDRTAAQVYVTVSLKEAVYNQM